MLTVKFVRKSLQIFVTIVIVLSMTSFMPARNVGAQQALPTIRVTPALSGVFSSGWGDGVLVTLEVDDPLTTDNPDCTDSRTANPNVYFSICPVKAGDIVTVSGGEITVAYTVKLLEIAQKDTVNDIISGIAEPNQQIFMHLDYNIYSNHIDIDTFSDGNGDWVFDFSKLTPPIDLVFGSGDSGDVHVIDGAGNSTERPFRFFTPDIKVNVSTDTITGEDFSSGETIHLKVDDPGTPEDPDYQTSAVVSMQNEFFGLDFPMEPSFLKPSFLIEMSGDQITKQITFLELVITVTDRNISGIGKPNSDFTLYAFYPDNQGWSADCYQVVGVDSSGHWTADEGRWFKTYQNPDYCLSIMNGLRLEAYQYDGDNDYIFASKTILPRIIVGASTGRIYSDGWGDNATVAVSVDDPQTVQTPDCSDSVKAEWGDAFWENCTAKVGDIVTVTGSGVSTVYTVPLLDVMKIDVANNTIEGIAGPNQHVLLQADYDNYTKQVEADTYSDANGHWTFDFANLTPPVDLKTGLSGNVKIVDEASNYTWHRVEVTVPYIYVFLNTSTIYGYDFIPSEMITLKVDDPNTPQNPDYETTAKNPRVDWSDIWNPVKFVLDQSFPLKPGYVVEVSDSAFTRQITLWNLSITSVDLTKDTVSGTSSRLGDHQGVEIYEKIADTYWGAWRYSYFDDLGNWSVDFANPNADPDEMGKTLDVKPGTRLWIIQYETTPEGGYDAVALDWTIPLQTFPNTPILDNFNRANGGLGLNWKGSRSAYRILGKQVDVQRDGSIYWKDAFGVNQEAYITINIVDPAGVEQDLLLKVQGKYGPNWGEGAIEVLYDAKAGTVTVWTFRLDTLKWYKYPSIPVAFANGDQFGAQALSTGDVVIFKNGVEVGRVTLNKADQAFFNPRGGYIGLWFIRARNAFFDDFGGGNVTIP